MDSRKAVAVVTDQSQGVLAHVPSGDEHRMEGGMV